MPELVFVVKDQGGQLVLNRLNELDKSWSKVGESGKKSMQEGEKAASMFGESLDGIKDIVAGLALTFGGMSIASQIEHWSDKLIGFETEFAKVTTLFDASSGTYDNLKNQLLDIGGEFGTSADLAKGLFATLQAGVSTADSMEFLKQSTMLSKTAFIDTNSAVDLLKVSLNAYGKTVDDAADTSETLFRIMRTGGGIDAQELARGLGRVAAVASTLGVPLTDVGAMIATLKQQSIPAAQSAVMLTSVMTKMTTEGSKLNKIMKEYNIDISKARIQQDGFGAVLADLGPYIKDDTDLMSEMGIQGRQLNAFLSLTTTLSDKYKVKLEQMGEAGKHMEESHARMEETLGEKWEKTINNAERAMDKFLDGVGFLKPMVDKLNETFTTGHTWINKVAAAVIGLALAFGTLKIVTVISQMSMFGNILAGLQLFTMVSSLADLQAAFSTLLLGINPVILALAVLTAAVIYYKDEISDAIIATGRWLGLVDQLPVVTEASGAATGRMAAQFGVSAAKMKELITAGDGAGLTLREHAKQIEEVRKKVEAGTLSQTDYEKALLRLIKTRKMDTDAEDKAFDAMNKTGKLSAEEKKKAEELAKAMEQLANPGKELAENLSLITRAGKSTTDFARAYSKQIVEAADAADTLKLSLPASIKALLPQAKAFEATKDKAKEAAEAVKQEAKDFAENQKKAAELLKNLPLVAFGFKSDEMKQNYQAMFQQMVVVDYLSGKFHNMAEIYADATDKLKWLDGVMVKNNADIRAQAEAFKESISYTGLLKAAYEELGISADKDLKKVIDAEKRINDNPFLSKGVRTDAVTQAVRDTMNQMGQLDSYTKKALDDMVFGTDAAVREKMIPTWMDYQRSLKDINGQLAPETVATLTKVMTGTDIVLKKEMLPLWQEYVDSIKLIYGGQLPKDIAKIDEKLKKQLGDDAGAMADAFTQEISTIFTDFSKGVADMIFDAQSMSDTIVGIFKEFAKMVVRTILQEAFKPVEKGLQDIIKQIFSTANAAKKVTDTGTTTGTSGGTLTPLGKDYGSVLQGSLGDWTQAATTEGSSTSNAASATTTKGLAGWLSKISGGKTGEGTGFGGIFGSEGSWGDFGGTAAGGALQMGAFAGGTMAFMDSLKSKGVKGWLEAVGGGAAIGTAILPGIGTLIGAAAGTIVHGIEVAIRGIIGKNAYQAGAGEVGRDFGGVSASEDDLKKFLDNMGIAEDKAYAIRKDILSSPQSLVNFIYPMAQAQGKTTEFLASLEKVQTAWGTFDFRKAFDLGNLTGDWTELDKAYKAAFQDSAALNQNVPDWQDKLLMLGNATKEVAKSFQDLYKTFVDSGEVSQELSDFVSKNRTDLDKAAKSSEMFADELAKVDAVIKALGEHASELAVFKTLKDGFQSLEDGLNSFKPAMDDMFQTFINQGIITDQLKAKITEYGGDLKAFQDTAGLLKLNNYFSEMVQHFKDTGEILPDLRKMFEQFGGDLSVLDQAAAMPNLKGLLTSITDLKQGLNDLAPDKSPIQSVLEGDFSEEVQAQLEAMGLDPSKLEKITGMIDLMKKFQDARTEFEKTGKILPGGIMEQMLGTYGGSAGLAALDKYKQGFNTVTPQLLDTMQKNMEKAFKDERKNVYDYLADIQSKTQTSVDDISSKIEDQFQLVSTNIATAFEAARVSAVAEIDKILAKIKEANQAFIDLITNVNNGGTTTTPTIPGGTGGDGGDGTGDNTGDNTGDGSKPSQPDIPMANAVYAPVYNFSGAVFNGWDDFKSEVAAATEEVYRDGGLQFLRSN